MPRHLRDGVRPQGRALSNTRSRHGDRMVFPRSWEHGEPDGWDGPDDDGPRSFRCPHCGQTKFHDGLEALSDHVRERMIASLREHGDPDGLLDAYQEYLRQHPNGRGGEG